MTFVIKLSIICAGIHYYTGYGHAMFAIAFVLLQVFKYAVRRSTPLVQIYDPMDDFYLPYPSDLNFQEDCRKKCMEFDGLFNFRDLSYGTENGKVIKKGKIFRSEQISAATEDDLEHLKSLEIATVVDLRTEEERQRDEDQTFGDEKNVHLPVYESQDFKHTLTIFSHLLFFRENLSDLFKETYLSFLASGAPSFSKLVRLMIKSGASPLLFHCTAGKDRAGICAALILKLLGVSNETILNDYSLSNTSFDRIYQKFCSNSSLSSLGVPNKEVKALFYADPYWMENLLTVVDEKYGGVEHYFCTQGNLSKKEVEQFRDLYLE